MICPPHTQAEFRRLVHDCIQKAESIYRPNFGRVTVTFDLRGGDAAQAHMTPHPTLGVVFKLRFNKEAIRLDWASMVNSTIPHEVAHLVAFALPQLDAQSHNNQWRQIAITLGDVNNGETTHNLELTPARRHRKFLYKNPKGASVEVSARTHRQLQDGECGAIEFGKDIFFSWHFQSAT